MRRPEGSFPTRCSNCAHPAFALHAAEGGLCQLCAIALGYMPPISGMSQGKAIGLVVRRHRQPTPQIDTFPEPKDPWHLLPTRALRAIVRVLGFGLTKHTANDWADVPKVEHYAALMRHLMAWREGEMFDPESKHPHLAHVGARLLMLLELEGK